MKQYFWHIPHPFIFNSASFAVPGVLTFVVIFTLAPFHFSELPLNNRLLQALVSAVIVCASILITVFGIKNIFPFWSKEERWNIGKEIILFVSVVMLIVIAHFGLLLIQAQKGASFFLFQQVVLRTISISIFPILGLVLFEQHSHRTKQLKKALDLNRKIRAYQMDKMKALNDFNFKHELVWFLGENGKPICQLDPNSIQFVKSEGNYYELYYVNENFELKKQLIRNKLSEAEKILPHSLFRRTHRSFLVNIQHVEIVTGNARDLLLTMKLTGKMIPVSRSNATVLLRELPHVSHSHQIPPTRPI